MTLGKCREVLDLYEKTLASWHLKDKKDRDTIEKLLDMIPRMREMLDSGTSGFTTEKFMRWLGFIQGVLWHRGWFTLDELKDHNRK